MLRPIVVKVTTASSTFGTLGVTIPPSVVPVIVSVVVPVIVVPATAIIVIVSPPLIPVLVGIILKSRLVICTALVTIKSLYVSPGTSRRSSQRSGTAPGIFIVRSWMRPWRPVRTWSRVGTVFVKRPRSRPSSSTRRYTQFPASRRHRGTRSPLLFLPTFRIRRTRAHRSFRCWKIKNLKIFLKIQLETKISTQNSKLCKFSFFKSFNKIFVNSYIVKP